MKSKWFARSRWQLEQRLRVGYCSVLLQRSTAAFYCTFDLLRRSRDPYVRTKLLSHQRLILSSSSGSTKAGTE
ncbi:hypothetical protein MRX96_002940 [Rhipicephalus microplus]